MTDGNRSRQGSGNTTLGSARGGIEGEDGHAEAAAGSAGSRRAAWSPLGARALLEARGQGHRAGLRARRRERLTGRGEELGRALRFVRQAVARELHGVTHDRRAEEVARDIEAVELKR